MKAIILLGKNLYAVDTPTFQKLKKLDNLHSTRYSSKIDDDLYNFKEYIKKNYKSVGIVEFKG